ncbi:MAG: hypothetical protein M9942_12955 [Microthrixaceae bacterium]|nr:hypothetical protein [Microthrixaceae bacterium]
MSSDPNGRAGPEPTEDPAQDIDIGEALRAALTAGADVRDTARHRVDRALHARSAATGFTSLLGCGFETLRHLLTTPAPGADRTGMDDRFDLGGIDRGVARRGDSNG